MVSAQTLPCRAADTCTQDLRLAVTQNDQTVGGQLVLALQVRTDGVAPTNTLGSATIDVRLPAGLAPSGYTPGELCGLAAYTCTPSFSTAGDVLRIGITSANVGTDLFENPGYQVGASYLTFATVAFTITDAAATADFTVDRATLTVGYFTSSNNADNTSQIDGLVPFAVIDDAVGVPLPVEMVSFEATAEAGAVQLAWTTASETQNAGFAVERAVGSAETAAAWEEVAL